MTGNIVATRQNQTELKPDGAAGIVASTSVPFSIASIHCRASCLFFRRQLQGHLPDGGISDIHALIRMQAPEPATQRRDRKPVKQAFGRPLTCTCTLTASRGYQ